MFLLLKKNEVFLPKKPLVTQKFSELYEYAGVPGSTKDSRMHWFFESGSQI